MSLNAYNSYLEGSILAAEPVELIRILYRAAIESVGQARKFLSAGDVAARSRQITRVQLIVAELQSSLNFEAGGEISQNLSDLYVYMQQRLSEANLHQTEAPLIEVGSLLRTLLEAWNECGAKPAAMPAQSGSDLSADAMPELAYAGSR